jgi:hypothetical protein
MCGGTACVGAGESGNNRLGDVKGEQVAEASGDTLVGVPAMP